MDPLLLLALLEEDELPLLEDELLELELELELVSGLLLLPSFWPQAATTRHEIAASRLSGSVDWRMRSVRIRGAMCRHDTYSVKMACRKMSRSPDWVFGTAVTVFKRYALMAAYKASSCR